MQTKRRKILYSSIAIFLTIFVSTGIGLWIYYSNTFKSLTTELATTTANNISTTVPTYEYLGPVRGDLPDWWK